MASEEDREILAKIGRLAGRINRHKNHQAGLQAIQGPYPPRTGYNGPRRGHGSHAGNHFRVGRPPTQHRHRSLVLNNGGQTPNSTDSDTASPSNPAAKWVSKTDRHLQLINSTVYDKETQARTRAIEKTRRDRIQQQDTQEKAKLKAYFHPTTDLPAAASTNPHPASRYEIEIHGLHFRISANGSKLVRLAGDAQPASATPKVAYVGGVRFYRSKSGNLYRDGVVRAHRKSGAVRKVNVPCRAFSTTGSCLKGPLCRYQHDASRVAVCKDYLLKGSCVNGEHCDLSHDLTPERTPTCLHFAKGNCANPHCHYTHSQVSPGALVCRSFGLYGYCEKGADCPERHAFECPDFSNTGKCGTKGCKLLHRERASVLRKAGQDDETREDDEMDDLSSDNDSVNSDDVDSDAVEELLGDESSGDGLDLFKEQKDFISF